MVPMLWKTLPWPSSKESMGPGPCAHLESPQLPSLHTLGIRT